ncbi:nicotinate (nicotinamide) nucleotide adenylyltransferase [Anaerobiospirillum succiniciproducens]|uniref:nicotinate (nicotinamide) nucleotide adenylyltransferase n=1 Tax=Anaerobiospirillum succiniciproducens TaxID=13335 RepID=UPI00248DEE40|nr:nicotinate (nicotinamide) nucleotide adenylyltransferase [Anaerobiospirillum succiniciproducens]
MAYIALYGGSFNPIHNGHIKTAIELIKNFKFDKLMFMPNASPPHKNTVKLPYDERMDMLKAALAECQNLPLEISTAEQDSSIAHYTYETLTELRKEHPNDRFAFIMGMDSLLALHTWKRGLEIIELCDIIVLNRPGYDLNDLIADTKECICRHLSASACKALNIIDDAPSDRAHLNMGDDAPSACDDLNICKDEPYCACGHQFQFAQNQDFDVSSTQLRELIASSPKQAPEQLYEFLSGAVIDIIYSRHFYGAN